MKKSEIMAKIKLRLVPMIVLAGLTVIAGVGEPGWSQPVGKQMVFEALNRRLFAEDMVIQGEIGGCLFDNVQNSVGMFL